MKHSTVIGIVLSMILLSGCGTTPVESPVSTAPPQAVPPTAEEVLPTETQVPALEFEIPAEMFWLQDFFLMSESRGYAVGNKGQGADTHPVILRTADGGRNWTDAEAGFEIGTLNSITFTDEVTGYACGQDWDGRIPMILRTDDGGQIWNETNIPPAAAMIYEAYFPLTGMGWAIGYYENAGSLLLRSEDGITWTAQDHSTYERASLYGITFPTTEVGYAVGTKGTGNPPAPYIIKTRDAGATWNELAVPLEEAFLYDVFFLNDLHGVVIGGFSGDSGVILVTKDGGSSWTVSRFPGSTVYLKWIFLYRDTLLVFGNDCGDTGCGGLVLISKDKGETWEQLPRLEGKVNAMGSSNSTEGLVAFALYTDAYASIITTHWEYFAPSIGNE